MGKPIIWSGVNAKLINSGDLIDSKNNSLTNGAKITVTQASHGFTSADVGRPLYLNGTTWTLAQGNTAAAAEVLGFIYNVVDANTLRIAFGGQIPSVGANLLEGGGSLTAGEAYFLSATTAGKITATEPNTVGVISKPLGVASSTTVFNAFNMRGNVVGAANARTQISLSNNTTANVQDMSGYDAGEIVGWIYIDATTDLRFLIKAQFAKAGAGTNYNLSYQTVGDTPPAGFSLTITSAGVIQYTMPSVTGFSSAIFNYALNAPAIGTAFPLSVDSVNLQNTGITGVTGSNATTAYTNGSGKIGETFSASMTNTTLTGTTAETDITGASLALTKGIWLISFSVSLALQTAATVGGESTVSIYLTDSSNVRVSGLDRSIAFRSVSTNSNLFIVPVSATTILNLTSDKTYKLRGQISNASGTAVSGIVYVTTSQFQGNFYAVRIA